MQRELPADLKEAVDLLAKSEKETDHSIRTKAFEDAIDILDDHLTFETDSPHSTFIQNIKQTYTRKLLEQLHDFFGVDIDDWFDYTKLFMLKVQNEVKAIVETDPQLGDNYRNFIDIWREEAIKLFTANSE